MSTQVVPGKTQLRRYVRQGLTQQQIVAAWEKEASVRVSRSAIAMAISRYGLDPARPRPRYEDTLPWVVLTEHRNVSDARMLRLEGRRREGGALSAQEVRSLAEWRKRLEDRLAVVAYDPRTEQGFWWVARRDTDDDIVRRP